MVKRKRGASSQAIRPDIEKVLRQAFPKGAMALALDIQKSHLADVFPRLKTRLLELDGAAVEFERDPLGGSGWAAGGGRLPKGPGRGERDDHPSSYYLFFLAATAEPCRVGDEETLKVGFSVALSVMAPMALVVLNAIEDDEDGFAYSVPDIVPEGTEDESGELVEIDLYCRRTLPAEGLAALERLREEIGAALEQFGYLVLPEEEQDKPVPWLRVPAMPFGRPRHLTVRDALFFWTP
ncbi:MAG TPA: hypothetical protein VGG06_32905 [Thermoanaerobaculia bacterium]|jgi:hypothetical protein